jgi:hypothetical protein
VGGLKIFSFGSGSVEPQIQIAAPAPVGFNKDTLKIAFFTNTIKVVTIYKYFFMIFFYKIFQVCYK